MVSENVEKLDLTPGRWSVMVSENVEKLDLTPGRSVTPGRFVSYTPPNPVAERARRRSAAALPPPTARHLLITRRKRLNCYPGHRIGVDVGVLAASYS
jgi:hypothetical protein